MSVVCFEKRCPFPFYSLHSSYRLYRLRFKLRHTLCRISFDKFWLEIFGDGEVVGVDLGGDEYFSRQRIKSIFFFTIIFWIFWLRSQIYSGALALVELGDVDGNALLIQLLRFLFQTQTCLAAVVLFGVAVELVGDLDLWHLPIFRNRNQILGFFWCFIFYGRCYYVYYSYVITRRRSLCNIFLQFRLDMPSSCLWASFLFVFLYMQRVFRRNIYFSVFT